MATSVPTTEPDQPPPIRTVESPTAIDDLSPPPLDVIPEKPRPTRANSDGFSMQPRGVSTPAFARAPGTSTDLHQRTVRRAPTAPNPTFLQRTPQMSGLVHQQTVMIDPMELLPRPPLRELLLHPKRKLAEGDLPWLRALKNTILSSWLNVALIFVPVSWALHFAHVGDTLVFVFSFLSIIPLAGLLGFATEQLALRVGDALGGLLNATFGNAVELLISILALAKGELDIVRSSMIGSILSNTLLVLGMCFFAGGLRFHEQGYGVRSSQLNISLMGIAMPALILPLAYHVSVGQSSWADPVGEELSNLLSISRGISFMLLFVYAGYLTFQLYTHAYLFRTLRPAERRRLEAEVDQMPSPPTSHVFPRPGWVPSLPSFGGSSTSGSEDGDSHRGSVDIEREATAHGTGVDGGPLGRRESGVDSSYESKKNDDDDEVEVPKLTAIQAVCFLAFITALTGITAEWLIDSIDGLTATGNISREFVALILLPLVGNAAEHVTAVVVSVKDKIDLSLSIAVGSSIQIALFVVPLLILIGWCIGQPLTLLFDPFESVCLFFCIIIVSLAIGDGKTNYMEGLVLMMSYVLIALIAWYYPGSEEVAAASIAGL